MTGPPKCLTLPNTFPHFNLYISGMVSGDTPREKFPANTSSVAIVMDDDIDLLTEILIRLPVKPLIRFKSVSRRWSSLITEPHFCRRHARRNPYAVSGLFLRGFPGLEMDYTELGFVSLNGNPSAAAAAAAPLKSLNFTRDRDPNEGIKILQCCNGLLLCRTLQKVGAKIHNYVFNPTTKQYSMLPPLNAIARSSNHGMNLAFDPLKSPYYKVVCVRSIGGTSPLQCRIQIYSNENGIWRNSGDPFTIPDDMDFHDGVFSNGMIHWISRKGNWMYFNVQDECLGETLSVPFLHPWRWDDRRFRYFGQSLGHLHLLEMDGSHDTCFKVFELEKDFSKWFLKFNVDLDPIVNAHPDLIRLYHDPFDSYYAFNILSIVREEDDDESSLLLHIPGEIISYKFKDNSFRKLHDVAAPSSCSLNNGCVPQDGCANAYEYIETLAFVHPCT